MKGETTPCFCNRAHNRQTRSSVEQVLAYNISRSPALLLMTGLWIESDLNNVPLSWDMNRQSPSLLACRPAPVDFAGLVIIRYAGHNTLEFVTPAYSFVDREFFESEAEPSELHHKKQAFAAVFERDRHQRG